MSGFRDPSALAAAARAAIAGVLVASCVALWSGVLEVGLLSDMRDGVFEPGAVLDAAAEANDARQRSVGFLQIGMLVASGVLVLRWIYRAHWNARELGAPDLKFTPAWAVRWYFVPIANVWKPYQAMRELWRASHAPGERELHPTTWLLPAWWFLWLVTGLVSRFAARLSVRASELDELIDASAMTLVSDALLVLVCVVFLVLVSRIQRLQAVLASSSGKD